MKEMQQYSGSWPHSALDTLNTQSGYQYHNALKILGIHCSVLTYAESKLRRKYSNTVNIVDVLNVAVALVPVC